MIKRGKFAIKNKAFILFLALLLGLSFSYLILVNATEVQEIVNRLATGETSLAHIAYEERVKHVTGVLLSMNKTLQVFEKSLGPERYELSVELVESVSWQGTYLKVSDQDIYVGSGGTKYINGWLIRHRGNIEDPNGTVYSNIDAVFVGFDSGCGLADHYECVNGSLHWLYCNGTDYGVVEECDACGDNECIKKGTFARWNKIREFQEVNSRSKPRSEGLPTVREENKSFAAAVSGVSE